MLEKERYSYQKYVSDISGQDIVAHEGKEHLLIKKVRNWLSNNTKRNLIGGKAVYSEYQEFLGWLPDRCKELRLEVNDLIYSEYFNLVYEFSE